jgi:hypothetical protein
MIVRNEAQMLYLKSQTSVSSIWIALRKDGAQWEWLNQDLTPYKTFSASHEWWSSASTNSDTCAYSSKNGLVSADCSSIQFGYACEKCNL